MERAGNAFINCEKALRAENIAAASVESTKESEALF